MTQIRDKNGVSIQGHIKIHDPESGKVYVNKRNAIHYENMSLALAQSIANEGKGFISSMAFGNGGTSIDPTGIITYLTPNSTGTNASLYNQTYNKIVDDRSFSSNKKIVSIMGDICINRFHKNGVATVMKHVCLF